MPLIDRASKRNRKECPTRDRGRRSGDCNGEGASEVKIGYDSKLSAGVSASGNVFEPLKAKLDKIVWHVRRKMSPGIHFFVWDRMPG